jgi:nucleotide-binding universal stress UspA family protein
MYQRIMVPLDGSELAECVLPHAEAIAKSCQATVELVRVIEPIEIPTRGGIALSAEELKQIDLHSKRDAKSYLKKVAGQLNQAGIKVRTKVLTGKVAESLADYIHKSNFDLIIMATHGRSGISRLILGSIADRLMHSSSTPVLLVRPPGYVPGSETQ